MKQLLLMGGILLSLPGLRAQEIVLTERAPLEAGLRRGLGVR